MLEKIRGKLQRDLAVYRLAFHHPKTPKVARWLLGLALAYAVTPIDLIPDFIPILGHLDDALIVPALVAVAVWLIPKEVLEECRRSCGA
ncbi:MAG: DUF1232 domain-containing protein [Acidobacteria bacterium]|nr:DUF1232 domain-containing protein [Acidobacteriota bacterium]